jgi:deoxyribose-phosphate aldolase
MNKNTNAKRILNLLDLTNLNSNCSEEDIITLCCQAGSSEGNTAAICIYPHFVPLARKTLHIQGNRETSIATVSNFPDGNEDIELALAETHACIAYGADEVDIVFPYRALIAGNSQIGFNMVSSCKAVCSAGKVLLKVIIESGELVKEDLIRQASEIAIDAGADFIKTSTGKTTTSATPRAASIMLNTIQDKGVQDSVGFKPAGGMRTVADAQVYLDLADKIIGFSWADKDHFRFGASSLIENVLSSLGHSVTTGSCNY